MRQIKNSISIDIPEGVEVSLKSRVCTVKGKHGTLKRKFKHLHVDAYIDNENNKLVVNMWHGLSKNLSTLRTFSSHINNMISGVRQKFEFKMRLVYSHFPINAAIVNNGQRIEIRNFLGEKIVRVIDMVGADTKVEKSASTKDELVFSGTDLEAVTRSCALVHQSCLCKKKDIRKFLDGIYVSEGGPIPMDE
jgi:large subunit ribosomal protein L9e